jgi:hypothetical protein
MNSEVLISIISIITAATVAVVSIYASYKQQRKVLKYQKYFDKQYEVLSFVYSGIHDIVMIITHIKVLVENDEKETQQYKDVAEKLRKISSELHTYIVRNEPFLDEKQFEMLDGFLMEAFVPVLYQDKNLREHLEFFLFIQSHIKENIRKIMHRI